jgi:hypothetical protein
MRLLTWLPAVFCFLQSCASIYKPIDPDSLIMTDHRWIGTDSCVEIKLVPHVLEGSGSGRYARMEKRKGVVLIALRIRNHGNDEMYLPEDLKFYTLPGDTILPLTLEESLPVLVKELDLEHSDDWISMETDPGWISDSFIFFNDIRKVQSHIRFIKNMQAAYLAASMLQPGEEVSGFLVLPVEKGIPFRISVR